MKISIDEIPDSIIVCDRSGTILSTNHAILHCFGYAPEELLGKKVEILIPERFTHHEKLRDGYMDQPVSRPMGAIQTVFGLRKDGTEVPLDISLKQLNKEDLVICFARDVSEHVHLTKEIEKTAYFDPITGALNRRAFNENLSATLERVNAGVTGACIGLLDLDHFKDVNDTLGHSVGDQLLVAFCDRLREVMTDGMRLFRIGGDEFALMVEGCTDQHMALAFIETALWHVRKPITIGPHELTIRCSAGVVHAPEDGNGPDELISNADLALYEAKRIRGRVATYSPSLRNVVEERFALLSEMQTALENNEFELYFQPQVDMPSGRIIAAEALLRWNHPQRGLLGPDKFIDILNESEISVPIGRWILFEACRQARQWQQVSGRSIGIAVNLFPLQTYSKSIVYDVTRAFTEADLDPKLLELELTENTILDSACDFVEILNFMRDLGVSVALDDFGTGYASLNTLTKYPVDTIKVDKSFVSGVSNNPDNQAVLRAMISLAKELGLYSVAEGVETAKDVETTQQLGFQKAQGYYWSRPLPAADFLETLKKPASSFSETEEYFEPQRCQA